jgi:hypothetical protein
MKYLRLLPISVATTLAMFGVGNAQAQSSITVSGVKYTFCGSENDNCTFSGKGSVVFGSVPPNSPTTKLSSPRTFTNGLGQPRSHHEACDASGYDASGYDAACHDAACYDAPRDHAPGDYASSYDSAGDNAARHDAARYHAAGHDADSGYVGHLMRLADTNVRRHR